MTDIEQESVLASIPGIAKATAIVLEAIISKKNEPFYSCFRHFVDAGKPKLVAIVATMRKLRG